MTDTIRDPRKVKAEALDAVIQIWGRCAVETEAQDAAYELHKLISAWKASPDDPNGAGTPATNARPTLSVADVAAAYNVSAATVYRRIKDGTLTPYRLGARSIRFDAAEVAEAFRP